MWNINLRPANERDWEFVVMVSDACMREYAEKTWGQWSAGHPSNFEAASWRIIQCNSCDIGCLSLAEDDTVFTLRALYILPSYQNHGIGGTLLRRIIDQARDAKKNIQLTVLLVNPARDFYERYGFSRTHSNEDRHFMTYSIDG